MATGCLSSPNIPAFDGLDDFDGPVHHTGLWPHEKVDFSGKRVGVIGTGSSAMQSIPIIAREADEVLVFQRTAHYAVPAHNGPISEERAREVKTNYPQIRARAKRSSTGFDQTFGEKEALKVSEEEREREFEKRWAHGGLPFLSAFTDLRYSEEANQTAGDFVRNKIREIVKDPKNRGTALPHDRHRLQASLRDHGVFRNFQPPERAPGRRERIAHREDNARGSNGRGPSV